MSNVKPLRNGRTNAIINVELVTVYFLSKSFRKICLHVLKNFDILYVLGLTRRWIRPAVFFALVAQW